MGLVWGANGDSAIRNDGNSLPSTLHSTQSAMKMLVSPWILSWRFEANTNFLPSGENIGNPSNVGLYVIRSSPVPSVFTTYRSKSLPFGSAILEAKMIRFPSGKKYGAKLAALLRVTWRFVPAIRVHCIDIQITVPHRSEYNFLAVWRYRCFGIIAICRGQALQIRTVRLGSEDVIAWINRPYISVGVIGAGRAIICGQIR